FGEKFRPLAVTGPTRLAAFPDVPTFKELGYPQIRGLAYSLNLPAGAPKAAGERLHAAASRALQDPEIRNRIERMGFTVTNQSPEQATEALQDEARFLADVAKKIGLEPQ